MSDNSPNLGGVVGGRATRFPGLYGPVVGTPPSVGAEISALLNGSLGVGDKIARISDIAPIAQQIAAQVAATMIGEADILNVTVAPPFTKISGAAWLIGNTCFVNLVVQLPAQASIAGSPGLNDIPLISAGLPNNALAGSVQDGFADLLVIPKYKRARAGAGSPGLLPLTANVRGGAAYLALSSSSTETIATLLGDPATGYVDYLMIQGHYRTVPTDSVP